jgi:hypothetical protein
MENELLKAIVCICSEDGTPKGVGLLIDSKHIVTCAHVVVQSVNYVPDEEAYLGRELNVILFVDGEPLFVKAEVVTMFPQSNVDFAGLRLKAEKTQTSSPIKFLSDTNLSGHSLKVYGFPNGYDKGVWSYGVIRGLQADGLLQVESNVDAAYFIQGGFSGSPVWDDDLSGWIGIVNQADFLSERRGATVVPASVLYQCWPEVVRLAATPEPQYLSHLVDKFQLLAGIIAYTPPRIEVTVKTRKPEPYKMGGIKWDSEFDDSKTVSRTDNAYQVEEIRAGISEVLSAHPRFVLLGELGSGKTTSLQYNVVQLAKNRLRSGNGPVPMFVDLSEEWIIPEAKKDNKSYQIGLRNLLEKSWNLDISLDEALSSARVIVFLDGLNEMGATSSQKVAALKNWLFGERSPKYVIIACRESSYGEDLDLGLPKASLSQKNSSNWEQIAINLIEYFNTIQSNQLQATDFISTVREKNNLYQIVGRKPYFTARLLNIWMKGKDLPDSEALILDDFLDIIWKRETEQQPDLPKLAVLKTLLGNLAFLLIHQQKSNISYNDLAKQTVGTLGFLFRRNDLAAFYVVVKAAKRADLVKEENSRYSFCDKFFENYFAATHILSNPESLVPKPEETSKDVPEVWQDAVTYFNQLLAKTDASNVLQKVAARNPAIAAGLVIEFGQQQYLSLLVTQLIKTLHEQGLHSYASEAALRVFERLGEPSHTCIVSELQSTSDDYLKKATIALVCKMYRVKIAIPDLREIISRESLYRSEVSQSVNELNRFNGQVEEKAKEVSTSKWFGVALVTAAEFALAIMSGQPPSLGTAGKAIQKLPSNQVFHYAMSLDVDPELQQKKKGVEAKIQKLNNALKMVESAKSALETLESIS